MGAPAKRESFKRAEVVPPDEPGQKGVTRVEIDVKPSLDKALDWGYIERSSLRESQGEIAYGIVCIGYRYRWKVNDRDF